MSIKELIATLQEYKDQDARVIPIWVTASDIGMDESKFNSIADNIDEDDWVNRLIDEVESF